jgi:LysM repeat protein
MEVKYHIDVTPEEDALFKDKHQPKDINKIKINFNKTFWIIFVLHVVVVGIIATTCSAIEAKKPGETKSQLSEISQEASTKEIAPTPLPTPAQPTNPVIKHPEPLPKEVKEKKYTEIYVVKQGDTIYSIAKKYKLDINRLQKINDIKDLNKITVGQILKFM